MPESMPITIDGWNTAVERAIEKLPHDLHIHGQGQNVFHEPNSCARCRAEFSLRELIDLIAVLGAEDPTPTPDMSGADCTAIIHHGPGHQSTTSCELKGQHDRHRAIYGADRQEARWKGEEVFSGFFDEPPQFSEEDA